MSEHCQSCGQNGSCSTEDKEHCAGPQEIDPLAETLSHIKHKIVVLSGKGGVGKSTVAANLAVALSLAGKRTGLLDVDVHGPSIPRLLSLTGARPQMDSMSMEPVAWSRTLSVMSLGFLLPDADQAVIWRGPVKLGAIRQLLGQTAWGDLDFLVVDCPPGTGDEPLTALQLLQEHGGAHAVVVTTSQGLAIDDVRRSISFCREVGVPILGIVENMSGYACPECKAVSPAFGSGAGRKLAQATGQRFLGAIPFDPELARSAEEGFAFMKVFPDSATGKAMSEVAQPILDLDA